MDLWRFRRREVVRFEGITLVDLRIPEDQTPHFREILLAALSLIKATDTRRFERVRRRLAWVVHEPYLFGSAEYRHNTRACVIRFVEPSPQYTVDWLIGYYARVLVHEATHGVICSRGITYSRELRSRIERLCVSEEQRFLIHLTFMHPDLATGLYREFDARRWRANWNATPTERLLAVIKRTFLAKPPADREKPS